MRTAVVIPDLHCPFHCERSWQLTLEFVAQSRPSEVVILGDFVDCYAVSSFTKDPSRLHRLQYEVERAHQELDKLATAAGPDCRVTYCEGNHEARLSRYIAERCPELFGLVPSLQALLGIPARGWSWVPYRDWYQLGRLACCHDLGPHGVNAARQTLQAMGGNVVFGHTHRVQTHYESTVKGEQMVGCTLGWLGDPAQVDYRHRALLRQWQHAIGLVYLDDDGSFWLSPLPIINRRIPVPGAPTVLSVGRVA